MADVAIGAKATMGSEVEIGEVEELDHAVTVSKDFAAVKIF
jgi:hypothetical protein